MATPTCRQQVLAFCLSFHVIYTPLVEGGIMSLRKSTIEDPSVAEEVFREDVVNAAGAALGCGGTLDAEQLIATRNRLLPMWQALPKNRHGGIERRALRYLCHRYFMRHFGISLRGFEPAPTTNISNASMVDILSEHIPDYLEAIVEDSKEHGFSEAEAAYMIVMLEQLISHSQITLLEHVYTELNISTGATLEYAQVKEVMESYMVHWLVGEDMDNSSYVFSVFHNPELRAPMFPYWADYSSLVEGHIQSLSFRRQQSPKHGRSKEIWSMQYSFEDSHDIVSGTTNSIGSFVKGWCDQMKDVLVKMDHRGMGRVPLSKFYKDTLLRRQLNQSMRFMESEAYLREIGALDETSSYLGKQVIIPNYLQSAPNCYISTSHYLVCCANECEDILDEIEAEVKAPAATATTILAVVGNLTIQATLEDDDPFQLGYGLAENLQRIAADNGGRVQLHGRLFAQWLHYAFPRECPFPHQERKIMVTPDEFGDDSRASLSRMHAVATDLVDAWAMEELHHSPKEELDWMSQWDWEEGHFVETDLELDLSAVRSVKLSLYVLGAACALLAGVICASSFSKDGVIPWSVAKDAAHHV